MNQSEKRIYLIQELLKESDEYNKITIPQKKKIRNYYSVVL